jgi:hypothetical protein
MHLGFANFISLQWRRHLFQFGGLANRVALRTQVADGSQDSFAFVTGSQI